MKETIINTNGLMFLIKRANSGHYFIKSGKAGELLKEWESIKTKNLQCLIGLSSKELRGFFL
jgi:hypothetical protein